MNLNPRNGYKDPESHLSQIMARLDEKTFAALVNFAKHHDLSMSFSINYLLAKQLNVNTESGLK